ncbi:MAG TPA: hypothetical protein VFE60_24535 [Roseiarcus sp.]|jgi:hypothetical protein|nr:hypothetical protein [Roseiarcus sp.]
MANDWDEDRARLKMIEAQTVLYQKLGSLAGALSFAIGMFTLLSRIAIALAVLAASNGARMHY